MLRPRWSTALRTATFACLTLACSRSTPESSTPALAQCDASESSAVSEAPDARDRVAEIDALARRARELFDVPGLAIAVVHRGEVVLAEGYGE